MSMMEPENQPPGTGDEMPSGAMVDEAASDQIETGRIAEVHGDILLDEMPSGEMS